jgi:CRP/FNR family transcriptional regulator/CRP/FNR family cyclic AMP-dependent transcriptional regulator
MAIRAISQVPLFSQLSKDDLEALAEKAQRRRFRSGQVVFYKDDAGTHFYVIMEGKVRIALPSPQGEEITLAILGPGDLFGEFSLLDGGPRSATAVAAEDVWALSVSQRDFLSWLAGRPSAAIALLRVLSRRLRRSDELLGDASFLNVPGRLAKKLLELSELYGRETPRGRPVEIRLTQEELGSTIGVTRESVNKYLRYFSSKGWVGLRKARIIILDGNALQEQVY